jgi:hypothetical protein
VALCSAASAAEPYVGRRVVAGPPQGYVSNDELRDYRRDQLEQRHEMERRSLRLRQKAERRAIDPDYDD